MDAFLVSHLPFRQGIAFGIACNVTNTIAVKLSPLELLLQSRQYDKAFNEGRVSLANQSYKQSGAIKAVELSRSTV